MPLLEWFANNYKNYGKCSYAMSKRFSSFVFIMSFNSVIVSCVTSLGLQDLCLDLHTCILINVVIVIMQNLTPEEWW